MAVFGLCLANLPSETQTLPRWSPPGKSCQNMSGPRSGPFSVQFGGLAVQAPDHPLICLGELPPGRPRLRRGNVGALDDRRKLLVVLFATTPVLLAQDTSDPVADWIRAHAIPFSTSEAGNGFDDLAGLENVIGDARIVALGEPTHGTHEAFQMKHRLLEYLVERHGFSIFSIEANMPEADALDAYVNGGEGDPRQLIAGYGWTGDTEEFLAMVEWMRAWNVAHPERPRLRFTGFDMQTPTVASQIAAQFLRKHAPHMEKSAVLLENLPARGEVNFTTATGEFPVKEARGK